MKSIVIAGNIGKSAATRQAGSSTVTGWSVAVEDRSTKEKRTIWFDCNWWGARGEKMAQYLTKGSKVCVSGEFGTREHDGKTYLTLNVNDATLMGGGQRDEAPAYDDRARQAPDRNAPRRDDLDLDTIPF